MPTGNRPSPRPDSPSSARPEPGEDLMAVVRRADMAMFDIKRAKGIRRRSTI